LFCCVKANENNNSNDVKPKFRYIKKKPNKSKQEITAPKIKYFNPASVENSEFLLIVSII
jgi:hypothetical protein